MLLLPFRPIRPPLPPLPGLKRRVGNREREEKGKWGKLFLEDMGRRRAKESAPFSCLRQEALARPLSF